jgi:hypothetical protein
VSNGVGPHGRERLQPLLERLLCVLLWELAVQSFVPEEHVQALNLFDQEHDRIARGGGSFFRRCAHGATTTIRASCAI